MEKYINSMIKRITKSNAEIALARFHVIALSMAMPILLVNSFVVAILRMFSKMPIAQLEVIAIGFLAVSFELIILGMIAIGLRAIRVKELAFMQGHNHNARYLTPKKSVHVGYAIVISFALFQVFMIWNLWELFKYVIV